MIAPGVEFDRFESIVEALICHIKKFFSGRKGSGTPVGSNMVPVASQELIERQTSGFRRDVPEGNVSGTEHVHRKLLDSIEFPNPVPEVFLLERILANKLVLQPAFDEVESDWATHDLAPAIDALVGYDAQPCF